jgi:hypothetical protein
MPETPPLATNMVSPAPAEPNAQPLSGKELIERRDAFSRHFDRGDGKFVAMVGVTPINYRDAAGQWQTIEAAFAPVQGGWQVSRNSLQSTLAQNSTAVQLETGGVLLVWQPSGLEASDGELSLLELAVPLPPDQVEPAVHGETDMTLRYTQAWSDPTLVEQFRSGPGALKQELILAAPPEPVPGAQWLELRATLTVPSDVQLYADSQLQDDDFVTEGPIELRSSKGSSLLTFAPPVAYEQVAGGARVHGRYRVLRQGSQVELLVQTPWDWWVDPRRQYPAVLDPTMQVINYLEGATINVTEQNTTATVFHRACVGHYVTASGQRGYQRGYVKFPLPTLPPGAAPTGATLVAVSVDTGTGGIDPTYHYYPGKMTRQWTYVHEMTEDWSPLMGIDTLPQGWSWPTMNASGNKEIIDKLSPGLGITDTFPATTWDVTGIVQNWYSGDSENHGFALKAKWEGYHFFEDELELLPNYQSFYMHPTFACFPTSAQWTNLDAVVADLEWGTADAGGLGLLINYSAPELGANELRTIQVPSMNPEGSYRDQYHEYRLPAPTPRWRLVASQGAPAPDSYNADTPLHLVDGFGELLMKSDAGDAAPGNESYEWQPNYLVVNGHQTLPADLRLRVQFDNEPKATHNEKLHYLQIADASPAPTLSGFGNPITVPITLNRELIRGQELDLDEDTTIEIKIPYASAGLNSSTARNYKLQIFAPGFQYGGRTVNGAELTRGPDAYEIEFPVPPGQSGEWLLVLNSNREIQIVNMEAKVTVCLNTDDVVSYPLDGVCVQLQRPPENLTTPDDYDFYQELGKLRLYSPGGFTGDCNTNCTTSEHDDTGVAVMPLIGFEGDDDHWVALKGGTFTLDRINDRISTTPDARLLLADFSSETVIVSLPVLRGQFEATLDTYRLEALAAPYVLVTSPMHPQDDYNGWNYEIDLQSDRLRGYGPLVRTVEPTPGHPATDFNLNGEWSITAQGGPSLEGQIDLDSVSDGTFSVGTLLVSPPDSGYGIEHNPLDASATSPAAIPPFMQVRMTGATIAQPENLGGAELAVQALLFPPGQKFDHEGEPGDQVELKCGTSCFDLRGPDDAMTESGPLIDRAYRMPDLIVQDSANTIMYNTAQGVEIFSSDHPYATQSADDLNFNYEAFGASVRTSYKVCPGPHDPFNDNAQGPDGGDKTTVIEGAALMALPNAGSDSGDLSEGPGIEIAFVLCESSLRTLSFSFFTGPDTAIPMGNSGLFLNYIGGTISLTPQQPNQEAYTTVVLEMRFRGMQPSVIASTIFSRGTITIDSRGLFDVQVQTGVQVYSGIGVGVDGHFWVAWSPLDLGFEVQACIPYDGFDSAQFVAGNELCQGNELLYGMLRAHLWEGQGWQHKYDWLPDDDALHVAARFEARITIAAGLIVDWGPLQVPPDDVTLYEIKLAFGEFCTNGPCTSYEWGVMGAYILLGYDVGAYYGFDSGISFFIGSEDYLLIDEAGMAAASTRLQGRNLVNLRAASQATTVSISAGVPSAMFGLAWIDGSPSLTLHEPAPGNRVIDKNSAYTDVTIAITPTVVTTSPLVTGEQTLIVIDEPLPGEWLVDLGDTNSATEFRFFYFANSPAPTMTLSSLPLTAINQTSIPITWTSSMGEVGSARLSLYYEMVTGTHPITSSQAVAGPIVERIPLTATGVYSWNVAGLGNATYKVYARIDNNAAVAVNDCGEGYAYDPDPSASSCGTMLNPDLFLPVERIDAPGAVRIMDTIPPDVPQGTKARPEDISSVVVRWLPNSEQDLSGYIVTCQQGTLVRQVRVPALIQATSNLSETARVNGLNAVPATCWVQAYDTSYNVSGLSASASATPSGVIPLPPAPVQSMEITQVNPEMTNLSWVTSQQATGYLIYYQAILYPLPIARTVNLATSTSATDGSTTGGYQANEGPSPINVGNVTSTSLTGLRPGAQYEAWVRPYDDDGRTGARSPVVSFTVPSQIMNYLPLVLR